MSGWFDETLHPNWHSRLKIDRILYESDTGHQRLTLFENGSFGRVLTLDGVVQTTEKDEFIYHEMLAHVPILAHGAVRNVLVIGGGDGGMLREVLKHAGVASATVTALVKKGLVERAERPSPKLSVGHEGWGLADEGALTDAQQKAVDLIGGKISSREFSVALLHGVTGSGKTRVYSEAVQVALDSGRGAIVLVPEISLTPQMVQRMKKEFGDRVAVVHSGLTLTERYDTWRAIREGMFPVVVGPRSAVFSPVRDLGVIIVDEEHEQTYKQNESPRYHARDVAVMLSLIHI